MPKSAPRFTRLPAADRARLAQIALQDALRAGGDGRVTRTFLQHSVRFELDGQTVFYFVPQDIARPRPENSGDDDAGDPFLLLPMDCCLIGEE